MGAQQRRQTTTTHIEQTNGGTERFSQYVVEISTWRWHRQILCTGGIAAYRRTFITIKPCTERDAIISIFARIMSAQSLHVRSGFCGTTPFSRSFHGGQTDGVHFIIMNYYYYVKVTYIWKDCCASFHHSDIFRFFFY